MIAAVSTLFALTLLVSVAFLFASMWARDGARIIAALRGEPTAALPYVTLRGPVTVRFARDARRRAAVTAMPRHRAAA